MATRDHRGPRVQGRLMSDVFLVLMVVRAGQAARQLLRGMVLSELLWMRDSHSRPVVQPPLSGSRRRAASRRVDISWSGAVCVIADVVPELLNKRRRRQPNATGRVV